MEDNLKNKIENLEEKPGVYFFKNAQETVIYVGKAKNLKKRVKNHFQKPDQHVFDFIPQVADIDHILAASEKEALILEQQFIKKLQPRWNVEWKDDKNYSSISFSSEKYPRAYVTHQPDKASGANFGPFVKGKELKLFLREIRKPFPYRTCRNLPQKPCFYKSLGLCAAPCEAVIRKVTSGTRSVYKEKKTSYIEMIAALESLIKIYQGEFVQGRTLHTLQARTVFRVECYDISNLSGTLSVGSMVVFQNGTPDKNQYRKFKIKTVAGQNDVASLKEVLSRRLTHAEWPKPDLIILDGGKGQLKAARGIGIPVIGLAKIGSKDGKIFSPFSKNYAQLSKLPPSLANFFLQIRDEAHRFAITFNKQRRENALNQYNEQ